MLLQVYTNGEIVLSMDNSSLTNARYIMYIKFKRPTFHVHELFAAKRTFLCQHRFTDAREKEKNRFGRSCYLIFLDRQNIVW